MTGLFVLLVVLVVLVLVVVVLVVGKRKWLFVEFVVELLVEVSPEADEKENTTMSRTRVTRYRRLVSHIEGGD